MHTCRDATRCGVTRKITKEIKRKPEKVLRQNLKIKGVY